MCRYDVCIGAPQHMGTFDLELTNSPVDMGLLPDCVEDGLLLERVEPSLVPCGQSRIDARRQCGPELCSNDRARHTMLAPTGILI
jgi:hypothetical protein